MTTLLNILRQIEAGVKAKMLTCDAEIVWHLYYNGEETAGAMFKVSRFSSTAFYGTLRRLTESGVICPQTNPSDRRSNVYTLNSQVRNCIDECFGQSGSPQQGVCAA